MVETHQKYQQTQKKIWKLWDTTQSWLPKLLIPEGERNCPLGSLLSIWLPSPTFTCRHASISKSFTLSGMDRDVSHQPTTVLRGQNRKTTHLLMFSAQSLIFCKYNASKHWRRWPWSQRNFRVGHSLDSKALTCRPCQHASIYIPEHFHINELAVDFLFRNSRSRRQGWVDENLCAKSHTSMKAKV